MKNFIKNLEDNFQIKIVKSSIYIVEKNTYYTDELGNITKIYLYGVKLKNLSVLFPIAKYLKILSLIDCDITSTEYIDRFKQLEILNLSLNPIYITKDIGKLDNLVELHLMGTEINSDSKFENFSPLNNLQLLNLDSTKIESIQGLENLKNLKKLNLSLTEIKHFEGIERLENLTHLDLTSCFNLDFSKIQSLKNIKNLEILDLSCCEIFHLNTLKDLSSLKNLRLSSTNIENLKGIEKLKNLEILTLSRSEINNIQGIEKLNNLKELDVSNTKIDTIIPSIQYLNNLEILNISHTKIKKLEFLPKKLEYIYALYCNISKISSLPPSLKKIDLRGNNLITSKIHPAKWFTNIDKNKECIIDLRINPINYKKIAEWQSKYPNIDFRIENYEKQLYGENQAMLYQILLHVESILIDSRMVATNGDLFSIKRKTNHQRILIGKYTITQLKETLVLLNKGNLENINLLELLFSFIDVFDLKKQEKGYNGTSFMYLMHLLFLSSTPIKVEQKDTLRNFLLNNIAPKSKNNILYLDNKNFVYNDKKINLIEYIEKYFESISKKDIEEIYAIYEVIRELFRDISMGSDTSYLLNNTYTFTILKEFLNLYKENRKNFYDALIKHLDYTILFFEPKEIIEEYTISKKKYNHRVKWKVKNKIFSYILYIFNDINSLIELLNYFKNNDDKGKLHCLLNIIFSHPIITENKKTYNFINKEVLETLPNGYAKNRVKKLLQMKLLKR